MGEKHPAKRRRKSRAAVCAEEAPALADAGVARKAPKKPRKARKKPQPPTAGGDHFDEALAAAALIEASLATEDANREEMSAPATPAVEEEWPAPSESDPAWVAAWVRGLNAEAQGDDDQSPAPAIEHAPPSMEDWATAAPTLTALHDDPAAEPPFDAPSLEELGGFGEEGETLLLDRDEVAPQASSPQPLKADNYEAEPAFRDPAKLEYLRRAREAAQAQALLQTVERRVPQLAPWTIAAGVAAPLLAVGAWAMLNAANDGRAAMAPAAAAAAAPLVETRRDPANDYRHALQRMEAGQTRDGLALLQSAAEAGFAPAQYRLAKIFEHGEGVQRDLQTAREWTERAARGGNCRAMHDVGVYYARGDAVARDDAAAFGWFLQAAELGVGDSQYNLGLLYQHGHGVEASAESALYWFLVAARQHDLNAIDRAVALAAQMAPDQVERAQSRARRFSPRQAVTNANDGLTPRASCARDLERPENS
jgi:TPR repeat protein